MAGEPVELDFARCVEIASDRILKPSLLTHSPAEAGRLLPDDAPDASSDGARSQTKSEPKLTWRNDPIHAVCIRAANQYVLYGRNFPLITMLTRSPFGSGSRCRSILKSIALMMPSPNSSWMSALNVVP